MTEENKTYYDKCSDKEKAFILEYIRHFNGTKAYLAVYDTTNEDTARANASRLLANDNVRRAKDEKICETLEAEKKELLRQVIDEHKRIAFSDITDIVTYDEDGNMLIIDPEEAPTNLIKEIDIDTKYDGGNSEGFTKKTKFKLYDKQKSLDALGKYLGAFNEVKEVNHTGELSIVYLDKQDEDL